MNIKNFIAETIETVITSFIVLLVIYSTVAMPELVWGTSMEPNFETGQRIIVDKISKLFNSSFERGEIIVFKPEGTSKHLIKRIVGLPGDIFKIYDCKVYISTKDGKFALDEYYLAKDTCTKGGAQIVEGRSLKVPEGQYVALGDNREVSLDTRSLGLITKNDVVGRVVFRFWPIDKIGFVK